ncbi:MAG: hypothetical protein JXB14_05545 [Candidatus Altiarchaeota archaeon]|nr:hypothetical protein [Candidatus Altiarchaeota archaeon]
MDSSTFLLFLILIGLAFTSGNTTMMYIGLGVGVIFLVSMGGAHHIIIAAVALVIIYFGATSKNPEYMMYSLLASGVLFLVFVLHGKEGPESMTGYPPEMAGYGLPMGY